MLDILRRFSLFSPPEMAEQSGPNICDRKTWLVGLFPAPLPDLYFGVSISVGAMIGAFATLLPLPPFLERKGLGRIQNRYGPNRVGPYGFLQPVADGLKAMTKEDVVPRAADQVVHFLAPLILVVPRFSWRSQLFRLAET